MLCSIPGMSTHTMYNVLYVELEFLARIAPSKLGPSAVTRIVLSTIRGRLSEEVHRSDYKRVN